MAFDESLAARIREALERTKGVEEKRMFGGVCFLLHGNLLGGVWKDSLIARLGPDKGEAAIRDESRASRHLTSPTGRYGIGCWSSP